MNSREEFEKWCRELYNTGFYHENSYVLNYHDLIGVKVDAEYMMYKAWQEATTRKQKIIDELQATLEKTVDEMKAHHLKVVDAMADKIDELTNENATLKRNQENAVKMFKELLLMLDKVADK